MRSLAAVLLLAGSLTAAEPPVTPVVTKLGSLERKLSGDPILLSINADSRLAVLVTQHGQLDVWDLHSGQRMSREQIPLPKYSLLVQGAVCTDHRRVYAWLNDHGLVSYDIPTKQFKTLVKSPQWSQPPKGIVAQTSFDSSLAISSDGRSLVAKHQVIRPPNNTIETRLSAWECTEEGVKERYSTELPYGYEFVLSADAKWGAFVASIPGTDRTAEKNTWTIHLLDARTGKTVREFAKIEDDSISLDCFTRDGSKLITHDWQKGTCVWDTTMGKLLRSWPCPGGGGSSIITPGDQSVLVGSSRNELSRYQLCDFKTGALIREFVTSDLYPICAAFSPDAKTLVTANGDQTIRIWDVASGKERFPLVGHAGPVKEVTWTADAANVVSGGADGTVRVWDVATAAEKSVLPPIPPEAGRYRQVTALGVTPDGGHVAVGQAETGLRIWDRGRNKVTTLTLPTIFALTKKNPRTEPQWIQQAVFVGGNLRVTAGDRYLTSLTVAGKVLAPAAEMPVQFGKGEQMFVRAEATIVAGAGVGAAYYEGGDFDEMRVWDFQTKALRSTAKLAVGKRPHVWAVSPDGRLGVVGDSSRDEGIAHLDVFDLATWTPVAQLKFPRPIPLLPETTFSADGRFYAVCHARKPTAYTVFETARWSPVAVVTGHGEFSALAFSPDGRRVATGGADSRVFVHDLRAAVDPKPPAFDAAACWADLVAADGAAGLRAAYRLADHPIEAVKLFREKLKPAAKPPAADLEKWLKALDAPAFADRQAATKKLTAVADAIVPELKQEAAANASPEAVRAVTAMLDAVGRVRRKLDGEYLRAARVVHVLEMIGLPGAELLKEYAAGAPGAFLTEEAAAARARRP